MDDFAIQNGVLTKYYGGSGVRFLVIPNGVTAIGDEVFKNHDKLKRIWLPKSLKTIGKQAFYNCWELKSIAIPDGVTAIGEQAFVACHNLKSVRLPKRLTSIEKQTFFYCYKLKSITIPDSVASIGSEAFCGCEELETVKLPKGAVKVGKNAFSGCKTKVVIPLQLGEGLFDVEDGVLKEYRHYSNPGEEVVVPAGVTAIGYRVFSGCDGLKSIVLPEGLKTVEGSAFQGCCDLASIRLPDSVTSIGAYAFAYCGELKSITFSKGLTSIGKSAFWKCRSLESVALPEGMTAIEKDVFEECSGLKNVTLPLSVTSIEKGAFAGCENLRNISVPDRLKSIDPAAFDGCAKLNSTDALAILKRTKAPDKVDNAAKRVYHAAADLLGLPAESQKLIDYPSLYYAAHIQDYGDWNINWHSERDMGEIIWVGLINELLEAGKAWCFDWKEGPEEFIAGLEKILPDGLSIDPDLIDTDEDDISDIPLWAEKISDSWVGYTLADLETGGDNYVFCVCKLSDARAFERQSGWCEEGGRITFYKTKKNEPADTENKTAFVVTGKLQYFKNRDELTRFIESCTGGVVLGSVQKKTDYLINNDLSSTSAKNKKAKELGIPVISEEEFLARFCAPEELSAFAEEVNNDALRRIAGGAV